MQPTLSSFMAQQSYTSLDIAARTGKSHFNVLADVRKTCEEIGQDIAAFERKYKAGNQKWETMYSLPLTIVYTVVTKYSTPLRAAVVRDLIARETLHLQHYSVAAAEKLLSTAMGMRIVFTDPKRDKHSTYFDLQAVLMSTTQYARPMTSPEIAAVTMTRTDGKAKDHFHVMADIRNMFALLGEDPTPYIAIEQLPDNQFREIFALPLDLAMILMTGYYTNERYAVVSRWLDISVLDMSAIQAIEDMVFRSGWEVDMWG